ncbi:MAG: hypothetical protein IPG64_20250 [Haliea sp.]|nr:hypothetical protein [Haliea sp.]
MTFSNVGVKALDDHTLQVRLNAPTPYFLQLMDHYTPPAVPGPPSRCARPPTVSRRGRTPGNLVGTRPLHPEGVAVEPPHHRGEKDTHWDKDRVQLEWH